MTTAPKPFQDQVPHVSGDSGASDIFHGGDDVGEPLTRVSGGALRAYECSGC